MIKGLDTQAALIYKPIQEDLLIVEEKLLSLADTSIPQLKPLLDHALAGGGKRVRSALTLLSSRFYPCSKEPPITMASAVELLHLATLIHDDTIDDTDTRRGQQTIKNRWGEHVAVLLGDYVFAASATFVCDTNNVRVIRRFAETIMELAAGEMVEYFSCYDAERARELYQDRIYRKTASLFCTAAETGAILGNAPEQHVQNLKTYGYHVGIAFQVVDDLLDVEGDADLLGKPVGNDLLHGVLTLPSIILLERYPDNNPINAFFSDQSQIDKLEQAIDMIKNSNIISECYAVIRDHCVKASDSLGSLPNGPSRDSLKLLSDYIRERTN